MDTEAFLKYDAPQTFEYHELLYNPDENPFFMGGLQPRLTENFESQPHNQQIASNNHSTSFVSTNCSIKNTPEYIPEDISIDSLSHDRRNLQEIPRVRKAIYKKSYEPIFDNNLLYKYEEDPHEYRKARKRLQNRESASRVRNRKRNQIEQIEDEMRDLKKKNEELMLHNASLTAENNMLKQQITFLQKIVMKTSKEDQEFDDNQSPEYILPMKNIPKEEEKKQIRLPNPASGHKHLGILCVFTIMLFILSNSLHDNKKQGIIGFSEQFSNQFDRSLKSLKVNEGENNELLGKMLEFLMEQYQNFCLVYSCLKFGILMIYGSYWIWFLYNFLFKKYVKLKIKKI